MSEARRRTVIRVALVALALPQLAIGIWALVSPRGWFDGFPGGGREWLPEFGPFNEHFVVDAGSGFLAVGVLLALAALWVERRVVMAAAVVYIAYQLPHAIYHWGADDRLASGDQVANGVALALGLVTAAAVLALARRRRPKAAPAAATGGRLGPPPKTLLTRATRWYVKRQYGRDLANVDAYLHHPKLLVGYGAFEQAVERSHELDHRLKDLATLKAAAVAGCEWCMDFGSWISRAHGVSEEQMRELPRHRASAAFTGEEKLVLDYAAAMSRTPTEADDALVARLRERFDDAQIVELTNVIAIENHRARFNHALGLAPQGFSEGSFCVLPERDAAAAPS